MKNILIISQYIAPVRAIASIRWTKISKYLKREKDVNIYVLTNKKVYGENNGPIVYNIDQLLEKDMQNFEGYFEFETGKIELILWKLKRTIKGKQNCKQNEIKNVGESGENSFAKDTWKHKINTLIDKINLNETVHDGYKEYKHLGIKFDIVVSTYGPIWPHLVAKKIAEDDPQIKWVADFRDIYAGNPYETEREFKKHKKFVSRELRKAFVITKVAAGLELFEGKNQKVVTLPNGYDWEEHRNPMKPEKFTFVYTGTFYPKETDLSLIFKAIRELIDEEIINVEDVKIIYAGNNAEAFLKQAYCMKVNNIAESKGIISRDLALELQQKAAILLQSYTYSSGFKSLWSGKMFEYMMSEKPIVFEIIGDIPSEQYLLMPKLGGIGVETCREKETYGAMKEYIKEKYLEWKITGNVSVDRDEEYVKTFSYQNIAEMFWKYISEGDQL